MAGGNPDGNPEGRIIQAQGLPSTSYEKVFGINEDGTKSFYTKIQAVTIQNGGSSSTNEFHKDGVAIAVLYRVNTEMYYRCL